MQLFDLHCDSIVNYKTLEDDFLCEKTQFSLRGLSKFRRLCQTMAVFVPDSIRGKDAFTFVNTHINYLTKIVHSQMELAQIAQDAAEIEQITSAGKCALLIAIESGAALAGQLEHVDYFAKAGVKMMTLVWNGENEIASGHGTDKGFTQFGRQVVNRMEQVNMVVDVSHLNDRGFDELCTFATKPFIATHSNIRTICSHKRNLTPEQFREIVKRKGLVGLNLYERFLSDNHKGDSDSLYRHIYEMLALGGEDVLACGSDFDGADVDITLNNPVKFASSAEYLLDRGISEQIIQKIFFQNALDFFAKKVV